MQTLGRGRAALEERNITGKVTLYRYRPSGPKSFNTIPVFNNHIFIVVILIGCSGSACI